MTTENTAPRKGFRPIFTATVTPASVRTRTGKNGKYTYMAGARVQTANTDNDNVTVMAFGKPHEEVKRALRKGRPVELAVQRDGGVVNVIGFPRAKAEPAAAAA